MNTRHLILVLAMLAGFTGVLRADDAPKSDKVAYLGVTAKPVDSTLRSQLNLPDDVGLTVMSVDHKGPSAADIQVNDVLQKLDDQLLIDAHQLVTLIHLHHAGDSVTLTLIREAKPVQVTIKLGEKQRAVSVDLYRQKKPLVGADDGHIEFAVDADMNTVRVRYGNGGRKESERRRPRRRVWESPKHPARMTKI